MSLDGTVELEEAKTMNALVEEKGALEVGGTAPHFYHFGTKHILL